MISSNERTYDDLCLSATVDDNSKVWNVDSGASIDCTPCRDCFSDYIHGNYGHIVRNGYRCNVVGKEKGEIKLSNGGTLVLKDVRHIPELQKNLLSVSGLDCEGNFVAFGEKQWKVIKGSMVVAKGERFWGAAVDIAVYLINRSPASALNGGIPKEEWSCKLVNYSFLRVFGCIAYAHIDKEERKKLDSTSQKCAFIGYGGSSMGRINELKKKLASTFSMKDLGEAKQLFGMRITGDRNQKKLWLSQEEYIRKVLRRFNSHASKPVTTPLAAHFKLSKELSPNNRENKEYMAQIHDKPMKGTLASSEVDSQTTVSWISKLQKIVALSMTEAYYVAVTETNKKIIWLLGLLTELGYGQVDCKLWTDSQSAIHLAKNSTFHSRTKHIQLRYHFRRSLLANRQLNLEKIEGNKNPEDMITKVVDRQKLSLCSTLISLR
ncbi:hypothetical protein RJ639_028380 [Escallonia herrerae]|uniref:Retrovirus-related Pol polyprotein from transposon TNT 1-94 n=1 Tax=Escallonia herrerae TaxID=1293975 RepID=A0AA88X930_9ASTE|nr:hypothetical protein RJ639_028380 [Escallonia herrerae]